MNYDVKITPAAQAVIERWPIPSRVKADLTQAVVDLLSKSEDLEVIGRRSLAPFNCVCIKVSLPENPQGERDFFFWVNDTEVDGERHVINAVCVGVDDVIGKGLFSPQRGLAS